MTSRGEEEREVVAYGQSSLTVALQSLYPENSSNKFGVLESPTC